MDAELDRAAIGPAWLKNPAVAEIVIDKLIHGQNQLRFFKLYAFVVMSNHVHALLQPVNVDLRRITKGMKGASAHAANQLLDRTGELFWQDESWDRWVRDGSEFERVYNYVHRNPVSAGLCESPENFLWSSAHARWSSLMSKPA